MKKNPFIIFSLKYIIQNLWRHFMTIICIQQVLWQPHWKIYELIIMVFPLTLYITSINIRNVDIISTRENIRCFVLAPVSILCYILCIHTAFLSLGIKQGRLHCGKLLKRKILIFLLKLYIIYNIINLNRDFLISF